MAPSLPVRVDMTSYSHCVSGSAASRANTGTFAAAVWVPRHCARSSSVTAAPRSVSRAAIAESRAATASAPPAPGEPPGVGLAAVGEARARWA